MPDLDALKEALIQDEGLRLRPYLDTVGKTTIGVGRNLIDRGITKTEAIYLLDNDIAECFADLSNSFAWFPTLDYVRQNVLLNMRFQLGPSRFRGFKQLLSAMQACDYIKAAAAMMDSAWADQVPKRAHRLIDEMRTGEAHA